VQREAVEEVGPTPLTLWLEQAGSGDTSDDDGQY
jgi:hypothetical protein